VNKEARRAPGPDLVLLKDVSRSFYLTLRVLPGPIRPQIALAYLLARATDTIADTGLIKVEARLSALNALRSHIEASAPGDLPFGELARNQSSPAERVLLERADELLKALHGLAPGDRALVRQVLGTITSGQELDLLRFGSATAQNIRTLGTAAELDDYTYRVAGCVGEFWTHLCRVHLFPQAKLDMGAFLGDGICFGKGLQLVNILRDIPADLRQGRCYLPEDELRERGLCPESLLDPAREKEARPVYDRWLEQAEAHLRRGWHYVTTLPYGQYRVRLACAWPVLIGLRTLDLLRGGRVFDPGARIKVSRREVKRIMARTLLAAPVPLFWNRLATR
jgi:farnesyl-diphosphate farnesyltransferase